MAQIPLLLIGDSVSSSTGLSRITRELAQRINANLSDTFEVGSAGWGGTCCYELPWKQYPVSRADGWTIPELPFVAKDFFGERKGILFFILNHSWLKWVSHPETLPNGDLKTFLQSGQAERWIYAPVDSEGPNGKLLPSEGEILSGFDRVLAYTSWGARVIDRTLASYHGMCYAELENPSTQYLPHGTDHTAFYPRSRKEARACFIEKVVQNGSGLIADDVLLLGGIATNTPRKDFGLFFEVCGELLKRGINVGAWIHTDKYQKQNCWDLLALRDAFGMRDRVIFTNSHLDDDAMAWGYAACDVTMGVGSEGWGYPISESLACGVPCITGDYAGAAEFTPEEFKITPAAYRYDGYYCNKRPVFWASTWADRVMEVRINETSPRASLLNPKYYWKSCWPEWESWLLKGVHGETNRSVSSAV